LFASSVASSQGTASSDLFVKKMTKYSANLCICAMSSVTSAELLHQYDLDVLRKSGRLAGQRIEIGLKLWRCVVSRRHHGKSGRTFNEDFSGAGAEGVADLQGNLSLFIDKCLAFHKRYLTITIH
jgi:hypothetical protein